mgnify:CR=1 FL=1
MTTVPAAHMAVGAGTMKRIEKQCSTLRAADPLTDGGVWAIIDDACSSCCHANSGEQLQSSSGPNLD